MTTSGFFEIWPRIYLIDLMRYLIPASLAFVIFYVYGKRRWAHLIIQEKLPEARQMMIEFKYSMSTVVIFSLVGYILVLSERAGITRIYHVIDQYGMGYFFLSLCIMVLFHDFYFYVTHRLMHHRALYNYVHKVHHRSINPSPWAAYSFHPLEAVIQAMVFPIIVFVLPAHTLAMFLFLFYMIVRNVLGHVGFEIYPKWFIKSRWLKWNTSTTHHSMHHQFFNCNYGLYFSWWDDFFKTTHKNYEDTFRKVKSRPKEHQRTGKHREKMAVSVALLCTIGSLHGQSAAGKWVTYNEQTGSPLSIIEISEKAGSIEGRVSEVFVEPFRGEDPLCSLCDGDRKDQKVIGMNFMWGFKRQKDGWSQGEILDPESGTIYSCKIWLDGPDVLIVRGYAGPLDLFYRTQTWRRRQGSLGSTLVGQWETIDDRWKRVKSVVEIVHVENELKGYIRKIFLMPDEGTDPVCTACRGDLKNAKIVGMKIISDFRREDGRWVDGKILDPGNGNTYSSSVWLLDSNTLKVRGYLGPFYRSQTWRRAGT